MKKLSFFLMAMLFSVMSFAETYTHTFSNGQLSNGTVTLSNIKWTSTITGSAYFGWDANKGIQIGKAKEPATAYTLSSSAFADKMITNITVNASMASSGNAKLQVSVGGVDYISQTSLTTSAKDYTGAGTSSGDVVISFTNTVAKAFYIKSISITYQEASANEGMILVDQTNIDFGKVTKTKTITVTGQNLNSAINAELQDGLNFSVEGDLTNEGGVLTVNFTATENGKYNDVLLLTSDEVITEVTLSGEVLTLAGQGTKETPYTVADVIALALTDKTPAWVEGYIVGALNSNNSNALEATGTEVATNFVLADAADETENYIPVALPSGDVRTALNLANNPENLGKKVAVYGTLETYFSKAGVKNVSAYEWAVVNHTITVEANNTDWGTVEGGATVVEGEEITVIATPATGCYFVNWTVNDEEVSTDAEYTFTVEEDMNLVANFKKIVYTVTATAENGIIEGLAEEGKYEHGTTATLTAKANEGYEFVNWTEGETVVSTEAEYTFAVLADRNLVANFKKSVTTIAETYNLEADAAGENRNGVYCVLVTEWNEENEDNVWLYQLQIPNFYGEGAYEDDVIWQVSQDGFMDWKDMPATVYVTYNEETNTYSFLVLATSEDGLTVYKVTLNVPAPEKEEEEEPQVFYVQSYSASVTKITEDWGEEGEPWLVDKYIWTSGNYDPDQFTLTVTVSEYFTQLEGIINGVEVIGVEGAVMAGEEEGYAVVNAQATDGINYYNISLVAELSAAGGEEVVGTRYINVTEAEIAPSTEYPTDLEIYGWSDTDDEVTVVLRDGVNNLYGEYTDLNVYINDWKEYYLAENTVATYSLQDELAVFEATVVNGKDTVVLTVSGTPWIHPDNIVPTDTVNHTIVNGTIDTGWYLSIQGENDEVYVTISSFNKTATELSIADCSYAALTVNATYDEIRFLRGQIELTTVGDVQIAYIGALGSDYKWYNIILTTGEKVPTGIGNINTTVAPTKVIENGQFFIIKNGVKHTVTGAIVK